ncbi:MAG: hypothetical protein KA419_14910 [Acidobacteria bacterium]|nr:hypothetical protein [Acidobacteriota bacterium]
MNFIEDDEIGIGTPETPLDDPAVFRDVMIQVNRFPESAHEFLGQVCLAHLARTGEEHPFFLQIAEDDLVL